MSVCVNVCLCRTVLPVTALLHAYRPCQSLLQEGPPHCPPPYWGPSWCSSARRTAGRASLHYPHLLSQLHLQFLSIAQPQSSTKDVRTEQPVGHWTGETICRLFAGSSVVVINQTIIQLLVFIRRISTVYTINTYMHCGYSLWLYILVHACDTLKAHRSTVLCCCTEADKQLLPSFCRINLV